MRLLLDENAPKSWLHLLTRLGHDAEHVIDRGWSGSGDRYVLERTMVEGFVLLTLNKFKTGADRRDALEAMTNGARIIRVTARGLARQERSLELRLAAVEEAFDADPLLRRVTIMNDFRLKYETEAEIRAKLEGHR